MNVKPLGDKVLIKQQAAVSKTSGGILIPDSAREKPKEGKVVALGDGKLMENGEKAKPQVKKGNRVLFTSYAGTEVKINGDEYLLMSQDDILAVIE